MRLTVAIATRGRPRLLEQTLEVTLANAALTSTRVVVAADEDDRATVEVAEKFVGRSEQVVASVSPRPDTIAAKWNRAVTAAPADAYLAGTDYAPQGTPGFDLKILETVKLFPDQIGVVYGRMANPSFSEVIAVSHGLVELTGGKIYHEMFPYWFTDHWLDEVAKMIGRVAFADVRLAPFIKPGTQEMREPAFWACFFDALAPRRVAEAREIILSPRFEEPPWRKRLLLGHHVPIQERSVMINNWVRGLSWDRKLALDDPRYVRIKGRALEILHGVADPTRAVP